MSDNDKQELVPENEYEQQDEEQTPNQNSQTMQRAGQSQQQPSPQQNQEAQQQMVPAQQPDSTMASRTGAIRESRIKDRPVSKDDRDSSVKIKIELDLEVEVDLYARVKGDVTIGLM